MAETEAVREYLASLPEDRRGHIERVRQVVLENLPEGYEECIQYGMLSYVIPLQRFPVTYNKQPLTCISLGNQKNYMSLHLMCVYGHEEIGEWFRRAYAASGKKLDMGKSCVRFKKAEDLPLDVISQAVGRVSVEKYIAAYERAKKKGGSEQPPASG